MTAERRWWCDWGCGREWSDHQLTEEGRCPKCGARPCDLGWRWFGNRHQDHYASDLKTVPKENRP